MSSYANNKEWQRTVEVIEYLDSKKKKVLEEKLDQLIQHTEFLIQNILKESVHESQLPELNGHIAELRAYKRVKDLFLELEEEVSKEDSRA